MVWLVNKLETERLIRRAYYKIHNEVLDEATLNKLSDREHEELFYYGAELERREKVRERLGYAAWIVGILAIGIFIFWPTSKKAETSSDVPQNNVQQLAPVISACEQLPEAYIKEVMSSSITSKEPSQMQNGTGTNCLVEGQISNGPDWILIYNVEPTSSNATIKVTKETGDTGTFFAFENGRYKGSLSYTTRGTSPADEQIGNDLSLEIARSLQTK